MSPASPVAGSFVRSGKVRDLYAIGEDRLLLVASDRLSAFDVVLPTEIPDKGRVLTGLSRFWFSRTESIVPNHLLGGRAGGPASRDRLGPGRLPRAARPDDALPPGRRPADRGHRPRLPRGLRLEGLPADGRRVRDPAAGRPARERPPARAAVHALDEGRGRPRREHRPRGGGAARRRGHGPARPGRRASSCTGIGSARRGSRPGSSWPTRSSSSGSSARRASCS